MSVGLESGFSSEEVLNIRFPLHRACRDGDVGALCSLLQCSTDQLSVEDSFYGWTPLHWAAHFGKLECVMRLVQVGCGVNSMTSRFAQTPAHIAAFGGHPQCLLWLLQAGADINRQDYVGETPLHKAARAGSIDCIKTLLLQGAKTDMRNASGLTAADLAHAQGFQECAQLLSNAQNQQLYQLNGLSTNGSMCYGDRKLIQERGILNGVPSRKRSLDCMEPNQIKKARTDDPRYQAMNGVNRSSGGDQMENMHMEFRPTLNTTEGLSLNGHCHPVQHLNGGNLNGNSTVPSEIVNESVGHHGYFDGLHFGHHNGFGDTAENMEDASSQIEHRKSVSAEEQYDHITFNNMHLFHGC
ncbi:ankyrin repeat domain-containing protein 10-like isoform X1 [Myxocyprinus asiaticus]|uniref:ankyrin repeat domain-containing protein 10-like isoform X1 n=1 Tax=Myxocyprinus asiaticus TaxID=70543 RepID=UPI002221D8BF|nr:ankyrin repeat domain-containing protein 10-like isoform X1 [Myxocyprinus asiaticus]